MFLSNILYKIIILSLLCYAEYLFPNKENIFTAIIEGEYFGYSVQLQASKNSSINGRVIVGAPRANSTYYYQYQPGAVFFCSIDNEKCEQFSFAHQNNENSSTILNENGSDHSYLGASLDTATYTDGSLLVCAPQWKNLNIISLLYIEHGMCYLLENSENMQSEAVQFFPLNKETLHLTDTFNSIFGQAGFSTHLNKEGNLLIVSTPGLYNWTGSLIQYDNMNNTYIINPNRTDKRIHQYSYFGYSITSGKFNSSNPSQIFLVSGSPRNNYLYGTVNIFDTLNKNNEPFRNRFQFNGTQMGEYFGSALAVADVNGDSLDDLIIGAPMFSMDNDDDIGRIYIYQQVKKIYKQTSSINFMKAVEINGEEKYSRFGTAISSLGDINKDGFEDIVVAAPYYKNHGAIFLFLGSKTGLVKPYYQKILGSDINSEIRGFGFSLSRGVDIDHNHYNDIAVGAYLSDRVVILNSRPIIQIQTKFINNISSVNIDTQQFPIIYCIHFKWKDIFLSIIVPINVSIKLQPTNMVQFENGNTLWKKIHKFDGNNEFCETLIIKAQDKIFQEVNIYLNYTIVTNLLEEKFRPIIEDKNSKTNVRIPFITGCKQSNYCKPNLQLSVNLNINESILIIGTTKTIEVSMEVGNIGENAFSTKLFLEIYPPNNIDLKTKPNNCNQENTKQIICDFKNPIITNEKKKLLFILNISKLNVYDKQLKLNATVSTEGETDKTDNSKYFNIVLIADVNVAIVPKAEPEQIENKFDIIQIMHQFNIEQIGKTRLNNFTFQIHFPYLFKNKTFLNNIAIIGCNNNDNIIPDKEIHQINDEVYSPQITYYTVVEYLHLNCTNSKLVDLTCKQIECNIKDEEVIATINIILDINTSFINHFQNEFGVIFTTILKPNLEFILNDYNVSTILMTSKSVSFASLTKWIIIGFAIGIVLISIILVILYKCGFFKRKTIPYKDAEQELITNNENIEDFYKNEIKTEDEDISTDNILYYEEKPSNN